MILLNIVYSVQMVIRLGKVNFFHQVRALLLLSSCIAFNLQNICRFLTKKFNFFTWVSTKIMMGLFWFVFWPMRNSSIPSLTSEALSSCRTISILKFFNNKRLFVAFRNVTVIKTHSRVSSITPGPF